MGIHSDFHGINFVEQTSRIAVGKGISIRVGTCFHEYIDLVAKHRPHQPVGEPFDPRQSAFDADKAFWVSGWDENGVLVHTQAMRPVDLEGLSLADYLATRFTDFPAAGITLDFSRSYYHPGPSAYKICGRVSYHGDFWLDQAYRNTGVSGLLARFAMAFNQLRWHPDYIFGIMPRPIAFKGLVQREGYMHSEPGAFNWHVSDTGKMREGFMVWMAREDISHLMTIPLESVVSIPAPNMSYAAE